jgi:hypothetical protein
MDCNTWGYLRRAVFRVFNVEGKISNKDLLKGLSLVIEHQVELLEKWKEIHE